VLSAEAESVAAETAGASSLEIFRYPPLPHSSEDWLSAPRSSPGQDNDNLIIIPPPEPRLPGEAVRLSFYGANTRDIVISEKGVVLQEADEEFMKSLRAQEEPWTVWTIWGRAVHELFHLLSPVPRGYYPPRGQPSQHPLISRSEMAVLTKPRTPPPGWWAFDPVHTEPTYTPGTHWEPPPISGVSVAQASAEVNGEEIPLTAVEAHGQLLDQGIRALTQDHENRDCQSIIASYRKKMKLKPLLQHSTAAKVPPDEKAYRYMQVVEQYLYKRDPTLKRNQYKFVEQVDRSTGEITHVFVPKKEKATGVVKYCKKYGTCVAGPILGLALHILWRGVGGAEAIGGTQAGWWDHNH